MNAPIRSISALEPRPLYGIGTVARLTGLKADTLRVWERRYGLGASHKSATGRRQYTQSDLDHLQLVAALVGQGVRIGEIAASDGKTLQILLERQSQNGGARKELPPAKSKVLLVGAELCRWLDEHQGCISAVSALLARMSIDQAVEQLTSDDVADLLVVHCPSLTLQQIRGVETLAKRLNVRRTLVVLYQFANEQWLSEAERLGCVALEYPIEPSRLAFEIGRTQVEKETMEGIANLSELVPARPRLFSDEELLAAAEEKIVLDCECPRHLSELIRALNEFEHYSSACSVDNWKDAAIHTGIYAYTCHARHLMEKALQSALEGRVVDLEAIAEQTPV